MMIFKVRCGQCIGCRLDHSLTWASRSMHQAKCHTENSFITLTFNDEKMPSHRSIELRPIQLFFKKLRKEISPKKIKILWCGEYSPKKTRPVGPFNPDEYLGEGQRPHYHAIIFNHDFSDKKLWTVRNDNNVYTSDILTDLWGQGYCTTGKVTYESAAYVARYSLKKINGKLEKIPLATGLLPYERVCEYTGQITTVAKEKFHQSNGIGKEHYNNYNSDIYPADHVIINGYQTRPSRYYDDLYDKQAPASMEAIKLRRIKNIEKYKADNTPARLIEREKVKMAQLKQLKREL